MVKVSFKKLSLVINDMVEFIEIFTNINYLMLIAIALGFIAGFFSVTPIRTLVGWIVIPIVFWFFVNLITSLK